MRLSFTIRNFRMHYVDERGVSWWSVPVQRINTKLDQPDGIRFEADTPQEEAQQQFEESMWLVSDFELLQALSRDLRHNRHAFGR